MTESPERPGFSMLPNIATSEMEQRLATPAMAWLDRGMAWLKRRERLVIVCGVALQVALLLMMIVLHALPLLTGRTICLKAQGYVTHGALAGDYLRLTYDAGQIPPEGIDGANVNDATWPRNMGRTVYASLEPDRDGRHMRVVRMSFERPRDGLFLRGRLGRWNQVRYGIEAYSLATDTARPFSQTESYPGFSIEIAVAPGGQARIHRLEPIADSSGATAAAQSDWEATTPDVP